MADNIRLLSKPFATELTERGKARSKRSSLNKEALIWNKGYAMGDEEDRSGETAAGQDLAKFSKEVC